MAFSAFSLVAILGANQQEATSIVYDSGTVLMTMTVPDTGDQVVAGAPPMEVSAQIFTSRTAYGVGWHHIPLREAA